MSTTAVIEASEDDSIELQIALAKSLQEPTSGLGNPEDPDIALLIERSAVIHRYRHIALVALCDVIFCTSVSYLHIS